MWQRIQTLYIGIATALIAALFFSRMATIIAPGVIEVDIMYHEKTPYLIMLIMLLTAGVCAGFCFKNWFLQARVCMLNALMLIGFQIWLAVDFFSYRNEMVFSFTMIFPLASAILNIMAARSALVDAMTIQAVKTTKKVRKNRKR
jgi:hypothetical protein